MSKKTFLILFFLCLTLSMLTGIAYSKYLNSFDLTFSLDIDGTNVLDSISVTTAPDTTSYNHGDAFDPTGMVVTAYYTDGTSAEISNYIITDGDSLTVGQAAVTTSYTENGETKTVMLPISVGIQITYNANGGAFDDGSTTNAASQLRDGTVLVGSYKVPTREHYTFAGWYADSNCTDGNEFSLATATDNLTVYAKWEAISYTISYELYDGMNPDNAPTCYTIEDSVTLPIPTRTGYTFIGWTGSNSTTPQTCVTIATGTIGDLSFTANWAKNATIVIDAISTYGGKDSWITINGVTYADNTNDANANYPVTLQVQLGTIIECGVYDEPYADSEKGNKMSEIALNNASVATTYGLNGGDFGYIYTVTGDAYIVLKDGRYRESGYMSTNNYYYGLINVFDSDTLQTMNFNLTVDLAGGSGVSNTTYTVSSESFTLGTPTRAGYTFTGWTGSNGTTPQMTVTIPKGSLGDKSYTANWETVSYSITYNLNSGTNPSGIATSYNIETATITLPTPTRTGYTFDGWFTSSGLTGIDVTQIAKGSTGDKAFYAKWIANSYTVTFDANGGTVATSSRTVTYDSDYGELPIPIRPGYKFIGWYTGTYENQPGLMYKNYPWLYYADTYSDMKNTFGNNEASLRNHYINNGMSEGRRVSQYLSTDLVKITSDTTLYAGWDNLIYYANPGDYVQYSANGAYSWRILYRNDTQLDLITTASVGNLTLSGEDGYESAVNILNTHAQSWKAGFAVSARSFGGTPSSYGKVEGNYNMTGWPYEDNLYTSDVTQAIAYGLVQSDTEVWLASRRLAGFNDGLLDFGTRGQVRTLLTNGSLDYWTLYKYAYAGVYNESSSQTKGFRPVVTLRSGLYIEAGTGTADDPYVLAPSD